MGVGGEEERWREEGREVGGWEWETGMERKEMEKGGKDVDQQIGEGVRKERGLEGGGGRRSRRGTACLLFDLCQFVCNCGLQFKIDGAWHTWIHYDKFHKLVSVDITAHRCIT